MPEVAVPEQPQVSERSQLRTVVAAATGVAVLTVTAGAYELSDKGSDSAAVAVVDMPTSPTTITAGGNTFRLIPGTADSLARKTEPTTTTIKEEAPKPISITKTTEKAKPTTNVVEQIADIVCAPNAKRLERSEANIYDTKTTKEALQNTEFVFNDANEIVSIRKSIESSSNYEEAFAPIKDKLASIGIVLHYNEKPLVDDVEIGDMALLSPDEYKNAAKSFLNALAWKDIGQMSTDTIQHIYLTQALQAPATTQDLAEKPNVSTKFFDGLAYSEQKAIVMRVQGMLNTKSARLLFDHEDGHLKQHEDCDGKEVQDALIKNPIAKAGVEFRDVDLRSPEEVELLKKITGFDDLYAMTNPFEAAAESVAHLLGGGLVVAGSELKGTLFDQLQQEILARYLVHSPNVHALALLAAQYAHLPETTPAEIRLNDLSPRDFPRAETDSLKRIGLLDISVQGFHDALSMYEDTDGNHMFSMHGLTADELGQNGEDGQYIDQSSPLVNEIIRAYVSLTTAQEHSGIQVRMNRTEGTLQVTILKKQKEEVGDAISVTAPPDIGTPPEMPPKDGGSSPEVEDEFKLIQKEQVEIKQDFENTKRITTLNGMLVVRDKDGNVNTIYRHPVIAESSQSFQKGGVDKKPHFYAMVYNFLSKTFDVMPINLDGVNYSVEPEEEGGSLEDIRQRSTAEVVQNTDELTAAELSAARRFIPKMAGVSMLSSMTLQDANGDLVSFAITVRK